MTIADIVIEGARSLERSSDSPRLDAELLLAQVLGLPRATLIARRDLAVNAEIQVRYGGLLKRRAAGEPLAYLVGSREFWSLNLKVTPAVLVPRPETETLVERALALYAADSPCRVLDLGTGSGAVALALKKERPQWQLTAVELSLDALSIARDNARALNLPGIDWRQGHWFKAVPGLQFDLIVSNPPYVAAGDAALARLSAEPALALTPGPSGLEALEIIIAQACAFLQSAGALLLEHGHTQGGAVKSLFQRHGFHDIETYTDLSHHPRVTQGILRT